MARMTKRHVWVSRFGLLLLGLCLGGPVAWSADPTGDVPWETVYQQTARSFVVVQYHLKKSDRQ